MCTLWPLNFPFAISYFLATNSYFFPKTYFFLLFWPLLPLDTLHPLHSMYAYFTPLFRKYRLPGVPQHACKVRAPFEVLTLSWGPVDTGHNRYWNTLLSMVVFTQLASKIKIKGFQICLEAVWIHKFAGKSACTSYVNRTLVGCQHFKRWCHFLSNTSEPSQLLIGGFLQDICCVLCLFCFVIGSKYLHAMLVL